MEVLERFGGVLRDLKAPLLSLRTGAISLPFRTNIQEASHDLVETSDIALSMISDFERVLRRGKILREPIALRRAAYESKERLGAKTKISETASRAIVAGDYEILKAVVDNLWRVATKNPDEPPRLEFTVWKGQGRFLVRDFGPDLGQAAKSDFSSGVLIPSRPERTSLGLLLASQLASQMGTNIKARRYKDGAAFYLDLPLTRQGRLL